jgi:hypothetical protein
VSAVPEPTKAPEFPPTPFLSPRNVPLWFSLLLIAAVAGLAWWTH